MSDGPPETTCGRNRTRSSAEVAFGVMRVLAIARVLWGARAALPFERLASIVDAPLPELEAVVMVLTAEGMVAAGVATGTVGLSERGAHELLPRLRATAVP